MTKQTYWKPFMIIVQLRIVNSIIKQRLEH